MAKRASATRRIPQRARPVRRPIGAAQTSRDAQPAARWIAGLAVAAVAVPLISAALQLDNRIVHWGKAAHGVEAFLVTLVVGLLLYGWRDRAAIALPDQLIALVTMCLGVVFGVAWEIVEFVLDWVRYSDVQKSNSDTMSDFLCNHVGAVIAALLAGWIYSQRLGTSRRDSVGQVAVRVIGGPSRILDRHGLSIAVGAALLLVLAIGALWFAGRPIPGLPTD